MNKIISDNIAVFVIIGLLIAVVALVLSVGNRKRLNAAGTGSIKIEDTKKESGETGTETKSNA